MAPSRASLPMTRKASRSVVSSPAYNTFEIPRSRTSLSTAVPLSRDASGRILDQKLSLADADSVEVKPLQGRQNARPGLPRVRGPPVVDGVAEFLEFEGDTREPNGLSQDLLHEAHPRGVRGREPDLPLVGLDDFQAVIAHVREVREPHNPLDRRCGPTRDDDHGAVAVPQAREMLPGSGGQVHGLRQIHQLGQRPIQIEEEARLLGTGLQVSQGFSTVKHTRRASPHRLEPRGNV